MINAELVSICKTVHRCSCAGSLECKYLIVNNKILRIYECVRVVLEMYLKEKDERRCNWAQWSMITKVINPHALGKQTRK